MDNDRLIYELDLTDWRQDVREQEPDVKSRGAICDRAEEGMTTGEIAKACIVMQAMGHTQPLATIKLLAYFGGQQGVGTILRATKAILKLRSGQEIIQRQFIATHHGRPSEPSDDGPESGVEIEAEDEKEPPLYVRVDSEEAIESAKNYYLHVTPGHDFNHLAILAAHLDEDELKEVVQERTAIVWKQYNDLTEVPEEEPSDL